MVGLLAAVAAALAVLVSLAHGDLVWVIAVEVAAAAGLTGYATAPGLPPAAQKKSLKPVDSCGDNFLVPVDNSRSHVDGVWITPR
jgi:hypothetical protein